MKSLDTPLIANRVKRQLSALGQKQMHRIISKAATVNNTHRYCREFRPTVDKIEVLVHSLILDHNITKKQLSQFQKAIKVKDGNMVLPSIEQFTTI